MSYTPDFWHWWILGVALVIVEAFAPGAFFVWMGVAAIVVGFVLWALPWLGWELQLLGFAILSVVAIAAWRQWQRRHPESAEQPALNRRGEQYVGRVLVLETAIENGYGRVRLGDSQWPVSGPDCPRGIRVRVVGTDGVTLRVEAAGDDDAEGAQTAA
ncbi:MAG: NfeD family protein [Burkholderiales bacterium]|nr:MAG: NfeD family protein [Burkholderiales bacterium]